MNDTVFKVVGIVGRVDKPTISDSLDAVCQILNEAKCKVLVDEQTSTMFQCPEGVIVPRLELSQCDLVVVVGGDGSILGVARSLAHTNIPVLGVNRGGLGFLAGISPERIDPTLRHVLVGRYQTEVHFLVEIDVYRDGRSVHHSLALNDVVVNAGSITRMMDFNLYIDDDFVYSQRSDGLIISTPTGSTAYALSAGGPIMHPALGALVIVPMFPHTLTARPLVVKDESTITILVDSQEDYPIVSADSQVTYILHPQDRVQVKKHVNGLLIAYPAGHNFYEACRRKLDWGSRLGEKLNQFD